MYSFITVVTEASKFILLSGYMMWYVYIGSQFLWVFQSRKESVTKTNFTPKGGFEIWGPDGSEDVDCGCVDCLYVVL